MASYQPSMSADDGAMAAYFADQEALEFARNDTNILNLDNGREPSVDARDSVSGEIPGLENGDTFGTELTTTDMDDENDSDELEVGSH